MLKNTLAALILLAASIFAATASAGCDDAMKWRYAERTYWKWHIYALASFPKADAVAAAKRDHNVYTGKTLQASPDCGATWHTSPPGKDIPVVDETEAVTGKVYGG